MIFSDIMDFTTFQNQSEYMEDLTNDASSNGANGTGNHPSALTYIEITHLTVIGFGIPCNIVIIFITSKCLTHRFSRYNILILFLAISDIIFLMSSCTAMNGIFGNIGFEGNLMNCRLINILSSFFAIFSSWLIVLIAFDRFLCVKFPIKSHLCEGKTLLSVVLIIMSIIIAGLSSLAFKPSYINSITTSCFYGTTSATDYLTIAITMGLESFYSVIPGVFVIVFNVTIIRSLMKHIRNRNKYINKSPTTVSSTQFNNTRPVTVMLVATNLMFLICRLPLFISDVLSMFFPSSATVLNIFYVASIIDWFDHSANLLVFCASSSVFRSQIKGIICSSNKK